jgi:hypothetical protein
MKLYIAGDQGMVGSALVRRYEREPDVTLLLRTRRELDLTNQTAVDVSPGPLSRWTSIAAPMTSELSLSALS